MTDISCESATPPQKPCPTKRSLASVLRALASKRRASPPTDAPVRVEWGGYVDMDGSE